ncbi:MAG: glycosyltransferase [Pseudomonadota bacterium]
MAPPSPLTALVVTHNRLPQLRTTLAALLASAPEVLGRVIIVDNGSSEGTGPWLDAQKDPRLEVVRLAQNAGGAGGFAAGLAAFEAQPGGDWVVLMDDDGRPEPGALEAFQAAPRQDAEGWVGAVRYPGGAICDMNRPLFHPLGSLTRAWAALRRGWAGYHLEDAAYAAGAPQPVDGGSFVGLFLHRRALSLAGLPRADLFLYGDDALFCVELRRAGGRLLFDPALRFEHDCATTSDVTGRVAPLWKAYYLTRNRILVYRRAVGPVLLPLAMTPLLARVWREKRLYAGPEGRAYGRLIRAAVADGLSGSTRRGHAEVTALALPN